jgi:hypothetical protein
MARFSEEHALTENQDPRRGLGFPHLAWRKLDHQEAPRGTLIQQTPVARFDQQRVVFGACRVAFVLLPPLHRLVRPVSLLWNTLLRSWDSLIQQACKDEFSHPCYSRVTQQHSSVHAEGRQGHTILAKQYGSISGQQIFWSECPTTKRVIEQSRKQVRMITLA